MPGHTSQAPPHHDVRDDAGRDDFVSAIEALEPGNRQRRVLYEMALFLHQPFIEMLLTFNRAN
jgi:hypothetical protein